jgi:Major Facilitator Superfamily
MSESTRRNRLLLLGGDGLSAFGTWIDFLAILTLAAYQFQVSPYQMAVVSAAGVLPGVLAGAWVGRLCDRGDAQRLLLASIVGRVGATAAILVCHDYALFVALVASRSVFATVAAPAINVMAVRAVRAAGRPRFYALLNVLNNTAKVLAPALGTVSSSLAGEAVALAMSLACSALSFVAFAMVRLAPREVRTATVDDPAANGGAALPSLVPLVWIAATSAYFVFMVNNLVPLVLRQAGYDKALLGLLVGASGAGNIVSGLWLAKRVAPGATRGGLNELLLPAVCQAAGFGAIGLVLWTAAPGRGALVLGMLFFVIGTCSARFEIAMSVHVAARHAASVGRAWGVVQSWQSAMILVAPLIGAAVLDRAGAPALFAFATVSAFASFGLFIVCRGLGALRPAAPTPTATPLPPTAAPVDH